MALYGIPSSTLAGNQMTPSAGTVWGCIDEYPFTGAEFDSIVIDGLPENYNLDVGLTKDAGTWTEAHVEFRGLCSSEDSPPTFTVFVYDNTTLIKTYSAQTVTTSAANYVLGNFSAGELAAWNAATQPRLLISPGAENFGATYTIEGARVVGDEAAAASSNLPILGAG